MPARSMRRLHSTRYPMLHGRPVAILGGVRIPFCKQNTAYADVGNLARVQRALQQRMAQPHHGVEQVVRVVLSRGDDVSLRDARFVVQPIGQQAGILHPECRTRDAIRGLRAQARPFEVVHRGRREEAGVLLPRLQQGMPAQVGGSLQRGSVRHARVILDQGCRIPEGLVVGYDPEEDRKRFHVTEKGITLITPGMLGQYQTHLH
jgi:hypothetical protein